jgi:hypothetical protein
MSRHPSDQNVRNKAYFLCQTTHKSESEHGNLCQVKPKTNMHMYITVHVCMYVCMYVHTWCPFLVKFDKAGLCLFLTENEYVLRKRTQYVVVRLKV